jgi:hypothetical protein
MQAADDPAVAERERSTGLDETLDRLHRHPGAVEVATGAHRPDGAGSRIA